MRTAHQTVGSTILIVRDMSHKNMYHVPCRDLVDRNVHVISQSMDSTLTSSKLDRPSYRTLVLLETLLQEVLLMAGLAEHITIFLSRLLKVRPSAKYLSHFFLFGLPDLGRTETTVVQDIQVAPCSRPGSCMIILHLPLTAC